ncbi:CDP-glycerol glycerophosphotransferase family protein [Irregularibacter muris]|uniref:CDP-glycerol glycerophosphotransferase family protein n=1 Tax=Irregularibacter muris TaxID=1796619 RepID=A0AAE3HIE0_9FIRM|nr:CDP-glycerol glycerophosphotransferase family protein [Irregularibacter muris]MCR1900082.1 CDP-glycerol glycerophosphotransferase family protein [Irregularibacter muris]
MNTNIRNIVKKALPQKLIEFIKRFVNGNYSYFFWIFPVKRNKIVVCNYYGKGYGDNGKYIVEEILRQKLNYDIVWLLKNDLIGRSELPLQVRVAKYGSLRALYELATAKIWINNSRIAFNPPKRKKQYYIQTWHGGIALKQVEKDVESRLNKDYIESAKYDSYIANLFISNSTFCTNMYRSAFWYNSEILEIGSPRCDILVNQDKEIIKRVRKHFKIDENSHILIYAPTFRADSSTQVYNIDFNRLMKVLDGKFGGQWNILVRLHPNISSKDSFMQYTSKIINATNYTDMYDLLVAGDILITDYSSTMFEFSFTHKPVILYAADIESYVQDRNFYFDIRSLPYPLAENNDQLINIIEKFDLNKYSKSLKNFLTDLGIKENGTASHQIVERIKKIIS